MSFTIREVNSGDVAAITRLSQQLGYATDETETAKNLSIISCNQHEVVLVAVHEQDVIAWMHIFYTVRVESGSFCEIGGLVVNEQYQGMGTGKLLIEQAKLWCTGKGIPALRVRCNVKRKEAHDFYLKQGFIASKQQTVFEMRFV